MQHGTCKNTTKTKKFQRAVLSGVFTSAVRIYITSYRSVNLGYCYLVSHSKLRTAFLIIINIFKTSRLYVFLAGRCCFNFFPAKKCLQLSNRIFWLVWQRNRMRCSTVHINFWKCKKSNTPTVAQGGGGRVGGPPLGFSLCYNISKRFRL